MKNNNWNLVTAVLNLLACICFLFATTLQTQPLAKGLSGVACICFLISCIGFLYTYVKNKNVAKD